MGWFTVPKLKLIEPVRELFKDEGVVGRALVFLIIHRSTSIPWTWLRHTSTGELSPKKLNILRESMQSLFNLYVNWSI